jgi:hypothetical protein
MAPKRKKAAATGGVGRDRLVEEPRLEDATASEDSEVSS